MVAGGVVQWQTSPALGEVRQLSAKRRANDRCDGDPRPERPQERRIDLQEVTSASVRPRKPVRPSDSARQMSITLLAFC